MKDLLLGRMNGIDVVLGVVDSVVVGVGELVKESRMSIFKLPSECLLYATQ